MATPEEERQIAQGLVGRANNARAVVERLQLEVQQRFSQRRAQLEAELRAELEGREGVFGDFMDDPELRPIWDAAVAGDPANGIPPTFDQQAQAEAVNQINTERVERGDPNIQNTVADAQQAAQQAAPFQQGIAESRFVESPEEAATRAEEEDFQSATSAAAAFQDQVVRPRAQREANVINAVEEAMTGDEQSIEAFTQQIESIDDSALRDQTIQLAQQAGMEFARPIELLGSVGADGQPQSVSFTSPAGSFASASATQLREGVKTTAAQFAQGGDGAVVAEETSVSTPVGTRDSASIISDESSAAPITFAADASRAAQGASTAQQVGVNVQNTPDTIFNMLFGEGAPSAAEARRRAEGGTGPIRAAGEAVGDFVSSNFFPESTQQQAVDADTARIMEQVRDRPRPVATKPLTASERARLSGVEFDEQGRGSKSGIRLFTGS